jgi:hypothetical protein
MLRQLQITIYQRLVAFLQQAQAEPERGDVPGWVLIVAMTVALVLAVWGIAKPELKDLIQGAMDKVHF